MDKLKTQQQKDFEKAFSVLNPTQFSYTKIDGGISHGYLINADPGSFIKAEVQTLTDNVCDTRNACVSIKTYVLQGENVEITPIYCGSLPVKDQTFDCWDNIDWDWFAKFLKHYKNY
jgi:hypothetical protein